VHGIGGMRLPVAAAAGAAVLLLFAGCSGDVTGGPSAPTLSSSPTVTATEPTSSRAPLRVGDSVELTGFVTEENGAFAFEFQPDGGGPTVPVLFPTGTRIDKGTRVIVKGRIVTLDAAALERDLRVDLNDDAVRRLTGRQVLFASSVTNLGMESATPTSTPAQTTTITPSP
jgi:hypothetical protein